MALDFTRIHSALAAHTAATQALLNHNATNAAAAKAAATEAAADKAALDTLAAEVEAQTSTLTGFNSANGIPAAA